MGVGNADGGNVLIPSTGERGNRRLGSKLLCFRAEVRTDFMSLATKSGWVPIEKNFQGVGVKLFASE